MTETTEKPNNWLNKRVSRRTVLKTAAGLAVGATAAATGIGISRSRDGMPEKATSEQTDRILTPEETNARIQEFIAKIDSVYDGISITPPAEFPDTNIIRSSDPNFKDKMPEDIKSSIAEEDYLTAAGVKKLAQNCNATHAPIKVRDIEYTKSDNYYVRHLEKNCEGVGFALRLAADQTGNQQAHELLNDWRQIHLFGVYDSVRTKEPLLDPTSYYELMDKNIYRIPQK